MEKVFSSVLDNYAKLSFFLLMAIALFFLINSDNFQLDASSDTLILEQDDDLKRYQELIKDYDSSDFLIVTFTSKQKFIKKELTELQKKIAIEHQNVKRAETKAAEKRKKEASLLETKKELMTPKINKL